MTSIVSSSAYCGQAWPGEQLAPGTAQITATAGADCSPGQACPQYALLLTIDVTVVA